MSKAKEPHMPHDQLRSTNRATASLEGRHISAHLHVQVTPQGLLAIGALVSGILLSVVPIVWVSTRKLPKQ